MGARRFVGRVCLLASIACGCGNGSSAPGFASSGVAGHGPGGAGGRVAEMDAAAGSGGRAEADAPVGSDVRIDDSSSDASSPDTSTVDSGRDGNADASDARVDAGPSKHHLMVAEYPGRIMEISADGKVLWEHTTPTLAVMFNVLPNGNVFYPHGAPSPGA